MTSPITQARVYANAATHVLLERAWPSNVSRGDVADLDAVFDQYDDDTAFVHAGLSDVNTAFGGDPYETLLGSLTDSFDSVLAPGFTPSFRQSGIYHKHYSRPEYGAFSRLFLEDADYRTDDTVHSILVKGDYRFDDCDHHHSFGEESCWAQLDAENALVVNVGTDWLLTTQHHYVEHHNDVPYNATKEFEGHIYYDDERHDDVTQTNYEYDVKLRRNHRKIQRMMSEKGLLDEYDIGGLSVLCFRARDLRHALEEELAEDPYYMVT